jgi:hypothetical protein
MNSNPKPQSLTLFGSAIADHKKTHAKCHPANARVETGPPPRTLPP